MEIEEIIAQLNHPGDNEQGVFWNACTDAITILERVKLLKEKLPADNRPFDMWPPSLVVKFLETGEEW
jgi:hypothetical protein